MKKDGKHERGQGRVASPVSRRERGKAWRALPGAERRMFGCPGLPNGCGLGSQANVPPWDAFEAADTDGGSGFAT